MFSSKATPLIIFGRPRAGTRFITNILNSIKGIAIQGELPPPVMQSVHRMMNDIDDYYRSRADNKGGRCSSQFKTWRRKRKTLMFAIWEGTSQSLPAPYGNDCRYFGYKRPNHEFYFDYYEDLFEDIKPYYVYCIRNFKDNFLSISSRWPSHDIQIVYEEYIKSLKQYSYITSRAPNRTLLFNLDDQIEFGFEYTESNILAPLNIKLTQNQRRNLSSMGPTNTTEFHAKVKRRHNLTDEEIDFIASKPELQMEFNKLRRGTSSIRNRIASTQDLAC